MVMFFHKFFYGMTFVVMLYALSECLRQLSLFTM